MPRLSLGYASLILAFALALATGGCAAPSSDGEGTGEVGSELVSFNDHGAVGNGEPKTDSITGSGNQGVRFSAVRSDVVTAEVTLSQPNSDAFGFIMDSTQAASLANDDGTPPLNHAKVQFPVRRNSSSDHSDNFVFVFGDHNAAGGTFTVKVKTCDRAASGPNHEGWRTYNPVGFDCSSLFDCSPGQFRFVNACGCGCATDP
jgi:hypothetical protein